MYPVQALGGSEPERDRMKLPFREVDTVAKSRRDWGENRRGWEGRLVIPAYATIAISAAGLERRGKTGE